MKAGIAGLFFLGGTVAIVLISTGGGSQERPAGETVARLEYPAATGGTPASDSTPIQRALRRFDEFLRNSLDSTGTVGAAATVIHSEDIAYRLTYGVRRAGTKDSVDRHTIFRLASVSKGFAGVLACQLHHQGRLQLDERVIAYLPGFRLRDSVNTHDLSIRHLLSHTSGLVPHAYDNLAEEGQEIKDILPRLEEVDIAAPPGRLYGYQNVLFSLIDTIAYVGTGKDYSELMAVHIFSPLKMNDASVGYRDLVWNSNTAFPHTRKKGEFYPLPLHTGYYNLLPAAGVNASIEDMGKWLKALLGNSPQAIPPAVLELISKPEILTPLKKAYTRNWDPIEGRYYSFGWRVFDYKGCRILYHGGYVRGYRAEIAFCPELDVGLAFLQNSPNGVASCFVPAFFNIYFEEMQGVLPDGSGSLENIGTP